MGATASNADIVRDLITNFFNAHDVGAAGQYFADDLKWHGGLVGDVEGVRPYTVVMRGFFAALPDVHAVEQDALESGNKASMRGHGFRGRCASGRDDPARLRPGWR